jgi:hypothetical protein
MLLSTGALFGAVAVALEATGPALVFGGIAGWLITHAA